MGGMRKLADYGVAASSRISVVLRLGCGLLPGLEILSGAWGLQMALSSIFVRRFCGFSRIGFSKNAGRIARPDIWHRLLKMCMFNLQNMLNKAVFALILQRFHKICALWRKKCSFLRKSFKKVPVRVLPSFHFGSLAVTTEAPGEPE